MSLGKKIQSLRKAAGYTQKQLAEACGVATGTIQQYELEKRQPRFEQLQKIAKALGVPLIQLIENMTFEQYKTTEEYKRSMLEVSAYEGILTILKHIYGNIEEKTIESDYGESFYYLVGEGNNSFILYEENVQKLLNYSVTSFPFLINEMKDTRPEEVVIDEILNSLNDEEYIKEIQDYIQINKQDKE